LQRISSILLIALVYPISLLPLPVLYGLSDVAYVFLRHIIRYRLKVVRENLSACFPELDKDRLSRLTNRYYRHLTELTIEGVKALSISRRQLKRRVTFHQPDDVQALFDRGQSVIVVSGHFGNWEWGGLAVGLYSPFQVVGLYLPHRNPYLRRAIRTRRSRFGTILVSPDEVARFLARYRGRPTLTGFIADQSPGNPTKAHWVDFLNRETAFLVGPGKLSSKWDQPLLFGKSVRLKRGYHRVELDYLDTNPKDKPPEVLTQLYAHRLEREIRQNPDQWLWSHRRWKHRRT
jgi:KDO2-lipid IV(A) lauroyltransferase